METIYQNQLNTANRTSHDRGESTQKVFDFEQAKERYSQRQWAKEHTVPRTTLQYWLRRKKNLDAAPELIDFFESPTGLAFLHRLVTAAHFEFTKVGSASIHNVSDFLKTCGLEQFVACSYTTQQRISQNMDKTLVTLGKTQHDRLAAQMPAKMKTLVEDETFHPQICLVAMDAVSNYILVEKYVENRDGKTWSAAVAEGLGELPVKVVQVASDEGSGLLNHVKQALGAHHSSDLFHVMQEIGRGSAGPLAAGVRHAEKALATATAQHNNLIKKKKIPAARRTPNVHWRSRSAGRRQLI